MKDKILVFQSDFGLLEGTVSQMYGISMQVDPTLKMFDLTHNITQFNTWEASYSLYQTCHTWPKETVFVSVVDPGVGSNRKSVVALTKQGHYIVTPNNKSLTHLKANVGIVAVREIDETVNRIKGSDKSHVFHGRDVYAYTGAKLASGKIDFEGVGPLMNLEEIETYQLNAPQLHNNYCEGTLEIVDIHFGMLWSNIPIEYLEKLNVNFDEFLDVTIYHKGKDVFHKEVLYGKSFASVAKGDYVIYNNEIGNLAIAINLGNFAKKHNFNAGIDWTISLKTI